MSLLEAELSGGRSWTRVRDGYSITRKPRGLEVEAASAIPFAAMEAVPQGGAFDAVFTMRTPQEIKSGTYFERGDLLVAKITPSFENGKQALVRELPTEFGYGSTEVIPLRPRDDTHDPRLLFYYLLHPDVRHHVAERMEGSTGRQRVPESVLLDLPMPVLARAEQVAIADALQTVQEGIAAEGNAERNAVDLKRAAMANLFTRGLRGEAQKESEIGPIPETWKLKKCEDLAREITVGVVVKPASHYVKNGVPAFRSLNIKEDRIDPSDLVLFSAEANDTVLQKSKLRAGDVLVVRTGYPGTSCVVPPEFDGANCIDLVILKPSEDRLSGAFLSRFLNSDRGKSQALSNSHGLAQKHLNVGAVRQLKVPVPPTVDEQLKIVTILETLDLKVGLHRRKRAVLEELFKSLLHKLMTGEIRVDQLDLSALQPQATPQGSPA